MLPTICALAGIDLPKRPLDGINLLPAIQGKMQERPTTLNFWKFIADKKAQASMKPYLDPELQKGTTPLVKKSNGVFTRNFSNYQHPVISEKDYLGPRSIISNDYKLVIDGDKGTGVELFNLKTDISESKNLAPTHPDIVEKMSKQLRAWQTDVLNSLMGRDY